jgi:hypothetical protein
MEVLMDKEKCVSCNNEYDFNEKYFIKDTNKKIGLRRICVDCGNKKRNIQKYKSKYGIILDFDLYFNTYQLYDWWKLTYHGTPNGKFLPRIPKEIDNYDNAKNIAKYVIDKVIECNDYSLLNSSVIEKYKLSFVYKYCGNSVLKLVNFISEEKIEKLTIVKKNYERIW